MRQIINKLVLLVPQIRRLVAERDRLAIMASETPLTWLRHRRYMTLNFDPIISAGSKFDDVKIVERLLKAYQRSRTDQYGRNSMWRNIFKEHHKAQHDVFMQGNIEEACRILSNPASSNIFYGFDELCALSIPSYHSDPKGLAYTCQDNLIRLAEGIGAFSLEHPGHAARYTKTPTDKVLRAIETAMEKELFFPDIYPGAVGLRSYRGPITYRAVQALYLAFRLRQLIQDGDQPNTQYRICEIGAGLGRSALHAKQLGLKNFTLVDVPMTTISQGYYLMRCLGENAVVLPGEPRRNNEQIKLVHSEDFFASEERYDFIANVDSITEFGKSLAEKYLRKISKSRSTFLSINHEHSIRILDLLKGIDKRYKISRYPYWMRSGYVEAYVRFEP